MKLRKWTKAQREERAKTIAKYAPWERGGRPKKQPVYEYRALATALDHLAALDTAIDALKLARERSLS